MNKLISSINNYELTLYKSCGINLPLLQENWSVEKKQDS